MAQHLGLPAAGVLVRGILIFKDHTEFPHTIKTFEKWEIAEWLDDLRETVSDIERCWRNGRWSKCRSAACMSYFHPCDYMDLCKSPDESVWRERYRVDEWSPLAET